MARRMEENVGIDFPLRRLLLVEEEAKPPTIMGVGRVRILDMARRMENLGVDFALLRLLLLLGEDGVILSTIMASGPAKSGDMHVGGDDGLVLLLDDDDGDDVV